MCIMNFTQYSATFWFFPKQEDEILQMVYLMLTAYFSTPKIFLDDERGQFSNDIYREKQTILNVKTSTIASKSPL